MAAAMESDDDFDQFSTPEEASSPARERKLKRLKKAVRVSRDPHHDQSACEPSSPEGNPSEFGAQDAQEPDEVLLSRSDSEDSCDENAVDSGFSDLAGDGDGSGARRALDFEEPGDELDGKGEDQKEESQDESGDSGVEESDKKRRSPDDLEENEDKKKMRTEDGGKPKRRNMNKVCRGFFIWHQ